MHSILIALGLVATIQYETPMPPPAPVTAEELITRTFGDDAPVMTEIARCESTMRQYDPETHTALIHPTGDVGLFGINPVHFDELAKLAISPYTLEGNIRAAKLLYDRRRFGDWYMSVKCWGPSLDKS